MRSFLFLFLCLGLCVSFGVHAKDQFLLWDSAIIASPDVAGSAKSVELVYSNYPLDAGQVITTFVPIGKSYRVMCCLKVQSGAALTLQELAKVYQHDADFVRRVQSITGPRYAYRADFLPADQLNKHMRAMADAAGDTYYSAVGLPGQSGQDRIKGPKFDWPGYGSVSIETFNVGGTRFRHQLRTLSGVVSIEEPSLPD